MLDMASRRQAPAAGPTALHRSAGNIRLARTVHDGLACGLGGAGVEYTSTLAESNPGERACATASFGRVDGSETAGQPNGAGVSAPGFAYVTQLTQLSRDRPDVRRSLVAKPHPVR